MDDASTTPRLRVRVREVQPGTAGFELALALAARVLDQDRHLASRFPYAQESHVLAAFDGPHCVGFLRYLVQVIRAEAGRPAVIRDGQPLREGYVEAFGSTLGCAAGASGPRGNGARRGRAGPPGATRCVPAAR